MGFGTRVLSPVAVRSRGGVSTSNFGRSWGLPPRQINSLRQSLDDRRPPGQILAPFWAPLLIETVYFILPPCSETLAMRSISHVAASRVELALCHRAPGVGFQEH